jgi:hypothetical protein
VNDAHTTPSDESRLTGTAEVLVRSLVKADGRRKWQVRVLTALVIIIAALGAVVFQQQRTINHVVYQNNRIVHQTNLGAVASCEAGNRARNTNKLIWDEFLTIAVSNPETRLTRDRLLAEVASLGLPAGTRQGLDAIIAANWNVDPANARLVTAFEGYIAAHEYPVNCQKVYGAAVSLGN